MGVNVRSVTARLNAEVDKYIADIRRAGRETRQEFNDLQRTVRTTNDRLGVTHERLGVVTKDFRDLHQAVAPLNSSSGAGSVVALGRNMDRGGAQIDRYSGRLKLVAQATALIGPAAVPIGAIGVPAVAGLGAAVGVTAASVLTLVASFQGVGDALEALNEYQLDPTVANFEAAQDALARLAPETRRFVQEANQFRPLLDDLRDAGAEELFPGLTRSLDSLVQRAPDVQRFLAATGRELGDLAAADAASIASERWDDFFTFLAVETPPTLRVVNQIIGDLTHGASELVMALDPGSDSFLSWVGDAADGFDRWASSEQGRADIAAFLDYARENGPEVADAFVAIVDAVAQIVQAAAPIGGPVLEGITALAKVTAAIAGSDLGTPFILGLAAMSAYDRGAALLGKTWGKVSTVQTQVNGGVTSLSGNVKTLATDLNNVVRYGTLATESSKRLGSQLRTAGKAAGVVGGLAIASSGAADSIGLTNTASLALMGTMFGAPGVIAGGLIGATLDYAAANDDLESALKAVDKAQRSMDFAQRAADLETLNKEIEANEFKNQSFGNQVQDYGAWLADIVIPMGDQISTFNEQTDEGRAKAEAFMEENLMLTQRMSEFYAAVEGGDPLKNFSTDLASVQEKADTVVPALQNAGYSIEQIQQMLLTREGWDEARDAVREYVAETDSVQGRVAALGDGFSGLDSRIMSTAESAQALADALDAILGPTLGVSEATDRWNSGLRNLDDELAEHGRSLTRQTNAADQNRAAIRSRVSDLRDLLVAEAETGTGAGKLSRMLRNQRQALLDAGEAAGLSRGELRNYLNELGLTPKLVRTIIDNVDEGKPKRRAIGAELKQLMERVVVPIDADPSGAIAGAAAANRALASVHSKTVYITTLHAAGKGARENLPVPGADGMTVPGPRYPYGDKTLIFAAPGEEVISNRYGQADRFRADRAAGRIPGYADGGTIATHSSSRRFGNDPGIDTLAGAARRAAGELDKTAKAAEKERDTRRKRLEGDLAAQQQLVDKLNSRLDQIHSAVAGAYQTDLFASGNELTGLGFTKAQLEARQQQARDQALGTSIRDQTEAIRLLRILQDRGLDGQAFVDLAANGEVDTLRAYVHMSRKELARYERRFEKNQALDRQLQQLVGADVAARRDAELRELRDIKQQLEHMRRENKNNSDDNAHKTSKGINDAITTGSKGR